MKKSTCISRLLLCTLCYTFFSVTLLHAQAGYPDKTAAFKDGEILTYAISYKAGPVNSDIAEVNLAVSEVEHKGTKKFLIKGNGKTYPKFKWFFEVNDTYFSYLDHRTLIPTEMKGEVREGSYRYSSQFLYDWGTKTATNSYRNHKRPNATQKTVSLQEGSFDALSLFYNLRSRPTESFVTGKNESLLLLLEDTVRKINFRLTAREEKSIKNFGTFKTLKFVCQLATSTGESFEDGNEFTIWISDDENKIPLYIESPIRVGSIRVRLLNFDNLKYDLTSRIKK